MVLVCAPGHRLAKFETVTFEDLAGEKVIGFDNDLTIRREIDRVLQLHDVEVAVAMEFDNIETIKRAVEIGAGVALLPEPTVLREVESGSLAMVPLATEELVRPLGIIHRRGKELGSTTRRFIELLQSEGQRLTASSNGQQRPAPQTAARAARNGHPRNGSDHHHDDNAHHTGHAHDAAPDIDQELQVAGGREGGSHVGAK